MKANRDIRDAVEARGFRLWELADALGMQDSNLSKKLRSELCPQEKERYFNAIETMTAQQRDAQDAQRRKEWE